MSYIAKLGMTLSVMFSLFAGTPLMAATQTAGDADFANTISQGVTVVDFYADWCAPCKKFAPTFDKVSQSFDGKAKFLKVNIDNAPNVARQYNVKSIPTVIIFKNGKVVDTQVGAPQETNLKDRVQKQLQ